eukprot:1158920-Pelagomonas_calceolata.AAC.10
MTQAPSYTLRDILGGQLAIKGTFGDNFLTQQHEQQRLQQSDLCTANQPRQRSGALSSLIQVHFTQPHMEPPPPHLPQMTPGGNACSAGDASSREQGPEQTGNSSSSSSSSSRPGCVPSSQHWWRSDPSSPDACVKLSEAMHVCGSEQCIPGEWQVCV